MEQRTLTAERFSELLEVIARLRRDPGCPYKKQTHTSLKPSLLEDAYELLEAIDAGDPKWMRNELGDLLHQVIFHCQIASDNGQFDAQEVVIELKNKLIRRHPHVFSSDAPTDTDVVPNEPRIKAGDEPSGAAASSLGSLPKGMPALARAQRMTERASLFGFDWPSAAPVWQKVDEEVAELKAACASEDKRRIGEEMGDLLFSLVNLCRFLDLEAEEVSVQATARFSRRFAYIEASLRTKGRSLTGASLQEMDSLWEEAKRQEARGEKSS